MPKLSQNQNKVPNQPCFEFDFGTEIANDEQTIQKQDEIDEKEYQNSLEVKELNTEALATLRKHNDVKFINGKYLIRW